ncbi:FG-GAP-like repeat-containing protein, partial [bacterium]|nr:FG-GAP-like repeat-containing protein [bacterium]
FWGSGDASGESNMFLFRNDNNVFVNVTAEAGLQAVKPPGLITWSGVEIGAWADYDLDGDLDLLVNQTNNPDFYFYRNDGGVFTNIAAEVGLTGVVPLGIYLDQGYWHARIQWVDFDYDGDPDFSAGMLLFRNDDGMFTEVSQALGIEPIDPETKFSAWFDYDVDGDLDFIKVVSWASRPGPNELWAYEDGGFVSVSDETGISVSMPVNDGEQSSLNVGDYDNDGDEDIFMSNNDHGGSEVFLLNDVDEGGGRVFADVAEFVGMNEVGDRKGGAAFDYNMDGALDIIVSSAEAGLYLYQNLAVNTDNHWVGFILEGVTSNRDAIGSVVTLVSGGKRQIRYHASSPTSWNMSENPYIHFGIGTATTIDSVIIRWPLGAVQVLTDVAIDQYHNVQETDVTSVSASDLPGSVPETFALRQNYPNPFNAGTIIEYRLSQASHVNLTIFSIQGRKVVTLVNGLQEARVHRIQWDGRDGMGQHVATGVYLYRLTAGDFVNMKKALFLK